MAAGERPSVGRQEVEFTLHYRGPLRSNRGPMEKHALRQAFHRQLAHLWTQAPLSLLRHPLLKQNAGPRDGSILEVVGAYTFAPLITSKIHLAARVSVHLLKPEPPGLIVTQGGDIDNRLKTLLDALKMPSESELPFGSKPEEGETPFFFCVLQDDALITRLSIETDRLLEPGVPATEAVLNIRVEAVRVVGNMLNLSF